MFVPFGSKMLPNRCFSQNNYIAIFTLQPRFLFLLFLLLFLCFLYWLMMLFH